MLIRVSTINIGLYVQHSNCVQSLISGIDINIRQLYRIVLFLRFRGLPCDSSCGFPRDYQTTDRSRASINRLFSVELLLRAFSELAM